MKNDKVVFKRQEGREEMYDLFAMTVKKMLAGEQEKKKPEDESPTILH